MRAAMDPGGSLAGARDRERSWLAFFMLAAAAVLSLASPSASSAAEPNPLLAGVIAVLPDVPLMVRGDVQKRDARGKLSKTYRVDMVLDWKADVPTARYTIRDAFGEPLQHLAITWEDPGNPSYQYFEGAPLRAAPLPPLNQTIQDTDLTWLDLSLSFLWWPGGELRGQASVRGRECDIIDVPAPEGQVTGFDGVRLWVERKIGIVMRAEGYDEAGELRRRMDVKSFKKIRSRWVIKDIDFISFPGKTKTTLLVRDVEERERFELPDRDQLSWRWEDYQEAPPTNAFPGEPIDTLPDLESGPSSGDTP